jgi:hypothetical protein
MTKTNLLSAALMTAALLTTPAVARQAKLISHNLVANARITSIALSADGQTCCRDRAGDFRGPTERDVWGHWGAYSGPMVGAP